MRAVVLRVYYPDRRKGREPGSKGESRTDARTRERGQIPGRTSGRKTLDFSSFPVSYLPADRWRPVLVCYRWRRRQRSQGREGSQGREAAGLYVIIRRKRAGKSTRQETGHRIPPDESQQAVRRILEESAAEYMPAIRAGLPASTGNP